MGQLSKQTKQVLYGNLVVMSLLTGRVLVTHSNTYLFLLWNLFLAFLPLCAAIYAERKKMRSWSLIGVSAMWLAFFPNAPYLITDLYHLAHFRGVPLWYDALLLFTSAFTGLAMGFISLQLMEKSWRYVWREKVFKKYSTQMRWRYRAALVGFVFFLSGFGVYLGRVLRWNSWDVLTDSKGLVSDIAVRVVNPIDHKYTWAFTIAYAVVLFFLYNVWCSATLFKKKNPGV
jgi:uncharacterized membrane protein